MLVVVDDTQVGKSDGCVCACQSIKSRSIVYPPTNKKKK